MGINESFPNIISFYISEVANNNYNCVAYIFGDKNKPWWPFLPENDIMYWPKEVNFGNNLKSFIALFTKLGYKECNIDDSYSKIYEKIALFQINNKPIHVTKQLDENWWESKLGSDELIKHKLFELNGGMYGDVSMMFKKLK